MNCSPPTLVAVFSLYADKVFLYQYGGVITRHSDYDSVCFVLFHINFCKQEHSKNNLLLHMCEIHMESEWYVASPIPCNYIHTYKQTI